MKRTMFLLLSAVSLNLEASYRFYRLKVYETKKGPKSAKIIESTLDPEQYLKFNGLNQRMNAELVDTWYCPGDTSRRSPCKKPKLVPTRGLASTEEKRSRLTYDRQPVIPR